MNKKEKDAMAHQQREVAQLADFNYGHHESSADVRGEAVAESVGVASYMPGTPAFTMACFKSVDVPDGTKLYLAPVSASAADAPSEPSELKSLEDAISGLDRFAESDGEGGGVYASEDGQFILRSSALVAIHETVAAKLKSRAADAPSEPSEPRYLSKLLREYAGNSGYSHNDYADTMRRAADALDSQPADFEDRPLKARVLHNELAIIIGCHDGRSGQDKAGAVLNWIEKHGQHVFVPADSRASAAPVTVDPAEIRNAALEESAKMLLNGYFLHEKAPPKLFAHEAAKAIREMKTAAPQQEGSEAGNG